MGLADARRVCHLVHRLPGKIVQVVQCDYIGLCALLLYVLLGHATRDTRDTRWVKSSFSNRACACARGLSTTRFVGNVEQILRKTLLDELPPEHARASIGDIAAHRAPQY